MTTKKYICILAGAALLAACAPGKRTETPTTPTPAPHHGKKIGDPAGKRTETPTTPTPTPGLY
jgi:hypothetical protein